MFSTNSTKMRTILSLFLFNHLITNILTCGLFYEHILPIFETSARFTKNHFEYADIMSLY